MILEDIHIEFRPSQNRRRKRFFKVNKFHNVLQNSNYKRFTLRPKEWFLWVWIITNTTVNSRDIGKIKQQPQISLQTLRSQKLHKHTVLAWLPSHSRDLLDQQMPFTCTEDYHHPIKRLRYFPCSECFILGNHCVNCGTCVCPNLF